MKRYTYCFSLTNKEKEIVIQGTTIVLDDPHSFIVKEGEAEVARFYKKEVQGYRRVDA
jgi:hypothetical protein